MKCSCSSPCFKGNVSVPPHQQWNYACRYIVFAGTLLWGCFSAGFGLSRTYSQARQNLICTLRLPAGTCAGNSSGAQAGEPCLGRGLRLIWLKAFAVEHVASALQSGVAQLALAAVLCSCLCLLHWGPLLPFYTPPRSWPLGMTGTRRKLRHTLVGCAVAYLRARHVLSSLWPAASTQCPWQRRYRRWPR